MPKSVRRAAPDGYKYCTKGEGCKHPDGPLLPATREYFSSHSQIKSGLQPQCRYCNRNRNNQRYHGDQYEVWIKKLEQKTIAPDGYKTCAKGDKCIHLMGPMLPASEFSPKQREKDGLERDCKECRKEYAYRYRHRDSYDIAKAAYTRRKELVKSIGKRGLNLVRCHRYHAKKRKLLSDLKPDEWQLALEYWRSECSYCSSPRDLWFELVQEHFIPVSGGGGYTVGNIIPACRYCNSSKRDSDPQSWVVRKFGPRKGAQILARIEAYFEWVRSRSEDQQAS
jgi:hypothetical protein